MYFKLRVSVVKRIWLILVLVGVFSFYTSAAAAPALENSGGIHTSDPSADIPWKSDVGYGGVDDIIIAFNHARMQENAQLAIDLPLIASMPIQFNWNAMTDGEKALWLINEERKARGLQPLHGVEGNVTAVAQGFAEWMLANNRWGHYSDEMGPPGRLGQNPAIAACHDNFLLMENLFVIGTTGNNIALPVERAVYNWMYNDSHKEWGHRHLILYHSFFENSAAEDREGFIGIGRASGGPYTVNNTAFPAAEIIVLNMFDPCKNWNYRAVTSSMGDYYLRHYSS